MITASGDDMVAQMAAMKQATLVALKAAVAGATAYAQQELRGQIRAADLGEKAANMVRSKLYPAGDRRAYAPAGEVYANGKSAARILTAFSQGALIAGRHGQMLAIPLPAAPTARYGTAMTPAQVEGRYNRKLVFVPLQGRRARGMLCLPMPSTKAGRAAPGALALAAAGAKGKDRRNRLVPMFILVPSVVLGKRLSPEKAMAQAEAMMPRLFEQALARMAA